MPQEQTATRHRRSQTIQKRQKRQKQRMLSGGHVKFADVALRVRRANALVHAIKASKRPRRSHSAKAIKTKLEMLSVCYDEAGGVNSNCGMNSDYVKNTVNNNIVQETRKKFATCHDFVKVLKSHIQHSTYENNCVTYTIHIHISAGPTRTKHGNMEIIRNPVVFNHWFTIIQCGDELAFCDAWQGIHSLLCRPTTIQGINNWLSNLENNLSVSFELLNLHNIMNLFGKTKIFTKTFPPFNKHDFDAFEDDEYQQAWENKPVNLTKPSFKCNMTVTVSDDS